MAEGPSEAEWNIHKDQLTRLYIEEKKPLREVMSLMVDVHGFVAKKNQYEKYLHHKWRLRKKSTAQIWKTIAPIIHDLDRQGQLYEIWINNEKKSAQTIRKEARRYIRFGKEDGGSTCSLLVSENHQHRLGSPTKLPQGVVIREVCQKQPRQVINLPFQSFEQYLGANLPIIEARRRMTHSCTAQHAEFTSAHHLITRRIAMHHFKVATLEGIDSRPSEYSPYSIDGSSIFSSSLHRGVIFCLANNYMNGSMLQTIGVGKILQHELGKEVFESNSSVVSYHSFQAITTNLFRSCVYTGDAKLVDILLSRSIPGITANKIYHYGRFGKTDALTVAAMSGHKDLIKVLLKHGAKVNQRRLERDSSMYDSDGPGNSALDFYIFNCLTVQKGAQNLDLEMVELLMSNGAKLNVGSFRRVIQNDRSGRSVSLLLSKAAMSEHRIWSSQRIFHDIFRCQPRDVMLQALETLLRYNIGLNEGIEETETLPHYPGSTTRDACLLDVVALRGDLEILMMLLKEGAQVTKITLIRAIQSQCEPLVQWLLSQESINKCTDTAWNLAISAAIEQGNNEVLDILGSVNRRITESSEVSLAAAARAGNWKLFRRFYELHPDKAQEDLADSSCSGTRCEYSLEVALACAIRDGQDSIAIELLSKGVCASGVHAYPRDGFFNRFHSQSKPYQEKLPLVEALTKRNVRMIEYLLDAGVIDGHRRIEGSDDELLVYAVEWGSRPVIKSIINAGLPFDIPSNLQALNNVVRQKDVDMLEFLLGAGIPINYGCRDYTGPSLMRTVLETAVRTNDLSMVEYILRRGADPRDTGAFIFALYFNPAIFDLLLQRCTESCVTRRKGWSGDILNSAIKIDNIQAFKKLVQIGADANELFIPSHRYDYSHVLEDEDGLDGLDDPNDPDDPDGHWTTDFENISRFGLCSRIDTMLPHDLMSSFGYAIIMSSSVGTAFVEYLLQAYQTTCCHPESVVSEVHVTHGCGDLCSTTLERRTAFLLAISTAHIPIIEVFVRHNADVNYGARLNFKRTPIQMAVESGSLEVVELLIRHGADVNGPAAQRAGATALQLAALKGYIRIAVLLLEHGADVHAPASKVDGRTALEGAAEHGRLDTIALLLQHYEPYGAEHELEFARAMRYAKDNGFDYIVDLIEQYKAKYSPVFDEFLNLESFED